MEEIKVTMLSIGCGNCANCPYRIKCKEYSDYMKLTDKKAREGFSYEGA